MGYFDWHGQPHTWGDVTRHIPEGSGVLDLGCGTGWLSEHYATYEGLDGSPDAVATAQAAGRNVHLHDLAQPLPQEDASVDAIVMKDILEHLDRPELLVREAFRVLRPGGTVFAVTPDAQRWVWNDYTHRRPFTRVAVRRLFGDTGFTVQAVGYDSLMRGVEQLVGVVRGNRRPAPIRLIAWIPLVRRNVWVRAVKAG